MTDYVFRVRVHSAESSIHRNDFRTAWVGIFIRAKDDDEAAAKFHGILESEELILEEIGEAGTAKRNLEGMENRELVLRNLAKRGWFLWFFAVPTEEKDKFSSN